MPFMHNHLNFIKNNLDDKDRTKFSELEFEKFKRVVHYMETTNYTEDRIKEGRKDFFNWFNEYDKRRGTDLIATFPLLEEFYNECKQ